MICLCRGVIDYCFRLILLDIFYHIITQDSIIYEGRVFFVAVSKIQDYNSKGALVEARVWK